MFKKTHQKFAKIHSKDVDELLTNFCLKLLKTYRKTYTKEVLFYAN